MTTTRRPRITRTMRPIPFADGYWISPTGIVVRRRDAQKTRRVKQSIGERGRRFVRIYKKTIPTARLVALVFHGSPPDDAHNNALHRDDDPSNDRATNLYWGTMKENSGDAQYNRRRSLVEWMNRRNGTRVVLPCERRAATHSFGVSVTRAMIRRIDLERKKLERETRRRHSRADVVLAVVLHDLYRERIAA